MLLNLALLKSNDSLVLGDRYLVICRRKCRVAASPASRMQLQVCSVVVVAGTPGRGRRLAELARVRRRRPLCVASV